MPQATNPGNGLVRHIYAVVSLYTTPRTKHNFGDVDEPILPLLPLQPDYLSLRVRLVAEENAGRRIYSDRSFGIGGGRTGLAAVWWRYHGPQIPRSSYRKRVRHIERTYKVSRLDIEDGVNQMLGRDPELHRPPILAWRDLIDALEDAKIYVTERDLIGVPLTVQLAPSVTASLSMGTGRDRHWWLAFFWQRKTKRS